MRFVTGQKVSHKVYGDIEIAGFTTVGDELEIYYDEKDEIQDIVPTVNSYKVEFIDENGCKHIEPFEYFNQHIDE